MRWIGILSMTGLLFLFSCRKEKSESVSIVDPFTLYALAKDIVQAESDLYYIVSLVEKVQKLAQGDTTGLGGVLPPCAEVRIDTFRGRIVIDFGRQGCVGEDSVLRRGRIIADLSENRWGTPGAKTTITTDSFSVANRLHLLQKRLTLAASPRGGGYIIYDTVLRHQMIVEGKALDWHSIRSYAYVEGYQTPSVPDDDAFHVEVQGEGTSRQDLPFNIRTLTPLRFETLCKTGFPLRGENVLRARDTDIQINYDPDGSSSCDRIISVKVGSLQPARIAL